MNKFIGRKNELRILKNNLNEKSRKLVSIIGRRGVGKSRLNLEFKQRYLINDENIKIIEFRGRKQSSKQEQIKNCLLDFNKALNLNIKLSHYDDWKVFFDEIFEEIEYFYFNNPNKKIVFIIDEFAWLHNKKSNFVEHFAYFYDKFMNFNILFVITASAVSWMNKNVLKTAGGLHHKVHKVIKLKAFSLKETIEYLQEKEPNLSFNECINYYFFTGGVARYLEKISFYDDFLNNVKNVYFNESNEENSEFNEIFNLIFESKNTIHKDIVLSFQKGNRKTVQDLTKELKYSYNAISSAVEDLVVSDILSVNQNFGKNKKDKVYFLSDLFCYFYIKSFNGKQINYSSINNHSLRGFAFEILVFLNIDDILSYLKRSGFDYKIFSWYNKKSQIDLIIDFLNKHFSLIEVKFYDKVFVVDQEIANNILNKKEQFLESLKTKNNDIDVIFVSLLGTKNNSYLNYLDVSLLDVFS